MKKTTTGYAALSQNTPLIPWMFERRSLRANDVAVKILYSGICHTDLHMVGSAHAHFPLVPGHEMMGEVVEVGSAVQKFLIGEKVLIGNIVDSCRVCEPCLRREESYCREYPTLTYDGRDRIDGSTTRGGFSQLYVADQDFIYHLPEGLDGAGAAPLLCAGVTTYSPMKRWRVGPGKRVGIVGVGGLGHIAIKIARALGAHVVAFTTSERKVEGALELGAHEVVVSTDENQMKAQAFKLDFILDTVSSIHSLDPYLLALNNESTLCVLGIPERYQFNPLLLTIGRRSIASSGSGGTKETQEMLEFCAAHNIAADIELIAPSFLNEAFQRLERGEVKYRFVIDMSLE